MNHKTSSPSKNPQYDMYITYVPFLRADGGAFVTLGEEFGKPFLLIQTSPTVEGVSQDGKQIFDSRVGNSIVFNPKIPQETHQTVLTEFGLGVNEDFVGMVIDQITRTDNVKLDLIKEFNHFGRIIELYMYDDESEFIITFWDEQFQPKSCGVPARVMHYRNRELAVDQFEQFVLFATNGTVVM